MHVRVSKPVAWKVHCRGEIERGGSPNFYLGPWVRWEGGGQAG